MTLHHSLPHTCYLSVGAVSPGKSFEIAVNVESKRKTCVICGVRVNDYFHLIDDSYTPRSFPPIPSRKSGRLLWHFIAASASSAGMRMRCAVASLSM